MFIPSTAALLLAGATSGFSARSLWEAWPSERFVATPAPCLRPTQLTEALRDLAEARHPEISRCARSAARWRAARSTW